jgi:hypothetical protein
LKKGLKILEVINLAFFLGKKFLKRNFLGKGVKLFFRKKSFFLGKFFVVDFNYVKNKNQKSKIFKYQHRKISAIFQIATGQVHDH